MRISGGTAKGARLKVPRGTRPTAEHVRRALFSSLADEVEGAAVCDLYCGSGAYGLEALSRGATEAVFVDRSGAAIRTAKANAESAGLIDRAAFRRAEALGALRASQTSFAIIFADPPYDLDATAELLTAARGHLAPKGVVVVEQRFGGDAAPAHPLYTLDADRRYGDTRVLVYRETT